MHHVKVTIHHQPDAGKPSSIHFSYQELLGHTDVTTAGEFAFRALAEGTFLKGCIDVAFPEAASYTFRFERKGLMGYSLTQAPGQPEKTPSI